MCVTNNTLFQTNQASVSGENEGWGRGERGLNVCHPCLALFPAVQGLSASCSKNLGKMSQKLLVSEKILKNMLAKLALKALTLLLFF